LREAITAANATTAADTIKFNILGGGPRTITPSSPLPQITSPLTIDGYSQPGSKVATSTTDAVLNIELSGGNPATSGKGLEITAANSTVKGLAINRWDQPLIITGSGATGNKVVGNYIGTDVTGTVDLGNFNNGVVINAPNNTVGGTTAAARNIISGSDNAWGVRIAGSGATGNKVMGNYIGTDKTGTADFGNAFDGVLVYDGAATNTIGGTTAGARNIISGNGRHGVFIESSSSNLATGNKVMGNYIGTDKTGTADLGNSLDGVNIDGASENTIGGPVTRTSNPRNIISGNDNSGVSIINFGADAEGNNKVMGNYIGTDKNGTTALGNLGTGVSISHVPGNIIGGTTAGARNIISGNGDGVSMFGSNATGSKVMGNYIGTDKTGTADLGNGGTGVSISRSNDNTVGGTTAGARNIISGNDGSGVSLFDGANKVMGNYIGTDVTGTLDRGNSLDGVRLPGASGNTIGGTEAGARNIIFGNGGIGVHISPNAQFADPDNRILSNSISNNTGLGIDLDPTPGVTANNDADPWQNFPELSSVKKTGDKTTMQGTVTSNAAETDLIIQFFSSPTADGSGFGEGKKFLGQREVRTVSSGGTDGDGTASFSFTTASNKIPRGGVVTATATVKTSGDTSEFSRAEPVS
jgi:titin